MANIFSRVWESLKIAGMTKEEFLKKAKEVHGGKYDYSKVRYSDADTRVSIICPKHGKFLITPREHIQGVGCVKCEKEETVSEDLADRFIEMCEKMGERDTDDEGLFSKDMLDDIFGADLNDEPQEEKEPVAPIPLKELLAHPELRGKTEKKGDSIIIYDCNGNISGKVNNRQLLLALSNKLNNLRDKGVL